MKYIYTCLLAFLSVGVYGQRVLSLSECREMALEHNKQSKASVIQIEKASQDIRTYRAKFFPHLSAQGNYLFNSNKYEEKTPSFQLPTFAPGEIPTPNGFVMFPSIPIEFDMNKSWFAGLSLTQPLYMGGKIRSAYQMSKIGKDMAFLNRKMSNSDVLYETDKAYWTLLKVEELVKVAQKYEEVVNHLLSDINNAFEVGMTSRNDILKVQVKLNEAKLQRRRAENAIRLAKMNLCHMIGLPLVDDVTVADQNLDSSATPLHLVQDVSLRPEYQLLSRKLDLKLQEIKLTRSDYLPQLGVVGAWNYYDAARLNDTPLFKGGSFSALFSIKVPLFQWGEGISKVKSKKAEHQMAQLQRDDASEKMMLEMTMALNQVDESKLEVEMTAEALSQAAENLKTSTEQFEVGLETLTEHLEAQTLWQKAWAENVEAMAQLRLNETNYLKASGQLEVDANH
ncbi:MULTISPECIES: TolC family protein [Bacteroides]|uniref:TolC family protein n=1 Tax=Bacteroides TaxID=816 RepID=UPI001DCFE3AE|nr:MULTISPECIES: TolC family protein [Bacteroides]HJD93245.1 TolC family protein [Bacteroides coprosuis]